MMNWLQSWRVCSAGLSLLCGSTLFLGCTQTPHYVDNPTGDCEPVGDGSRSGHSPGDSQYLPDCDPPLKREYYRVFAVEDGSAYMINRPDSTGLLYGYCDGDDKELAALFERNGLCVEVGDPEVINSMTPSDALAISHQLHLNLLFQAKELSGETSWNISPGAFSDDIHAACQKDAVDLSGSQEACAWHAEKATGQNTDDMGRLFTETEAQQLSVALNELYGIK